MKLKSRWLKSAGEVTAGDAGSEGVSSGEGGEAEEGRPEGLGFEEIPRSVYLCPESRTGERMRCECRPEEGGSVEGMCGAECLNRLLYIECRGKCGGGRCGNQRMGRGEKARVEVFDAGDKGRGLRALQSLRRDDFILEYVGEVMDAEQMRRRLRRYARDPAHKHHYCMALKTNLIVDATLRGSISRFINHSCEPNAITQKWTVDGSLRVGFFALKDIAPGEEITFDYKFERFGKTTQKCLCGTASCRGVIGEAKEEAEEEEPEARRQRRQRRKRAQNLAEDERMAEELASLEAKGQLRSRQDVLELSRLMVRGEDADSRSKMLRLLRASHDEPLRLFRDFSGLTILHLWLCENLHLPPAQELRLKLDILDVVGRVPVGNRTQLEDSNLLQWVRRSSEEDAGAGQAVEPEVRSTVVRLVERVSGAGNSSDSPESPESTPSSDPDSASHSPAQAQEEDVQALQEELRQRCRGLDSNWSHLRQEFKIPKRTSVSGPAAKSRAPEPPRPPPQEPRNRERSPRQTERRERRRSPSRTRTSREVRSRSPPPRPRRQSRDSREAPPRSVRPQSPSEWAGGEASGAREHLGPPPVSGSQPSGSSGRPRKRKSRFDIGPDGEDLSAGVAGAPLTSEELARRRKAFESRFQAEIAEATSVSDFDLDQTTVDMDIDPPVGAQEPAPSGWGPPTGGPAPSRFLPPVDYAQLPEPQPATVTLDEDSGRFWWTERTSGQSIFPLSPEDLEAVRTGDWTRLPYFTYEPHTGLIHRHAHQPGARSDRELRNLRAKVAALEQELAVRAAESGQATPSTGPQPSQLPPPPPDLHPMWRQALDPEGNVYFYHSITRETTWEVPTRDMEGPASPATSPPPTVVDIVSPGPSEAGAAAGTATAGTGAAAAAAEEGGVSSTTAAVDSGSALLRKAKEEFKAGLSAAVCRWLGPYRKKTAKAGRIASSEDFKHVARKLTHAVWDKELGRVGGAVGELRLSHSVLAKAKAYLRAYMERQGPVYQRRPTAQP